MEAADQGASGANGQRPSPPPLPLKVRLQLIALSAVVDAVQRSDGTVNRCLYFVIDRLLSVRASACPDAAGVRSYDFTINASRGVWARIFAPAAAATSGPPRPVIVYFHGGGFTLFSPAIFLFDRVGRRFCSGIDAVIVSVNYRLAPEHRYPAAYEDGVDVLRFIDTNGVPGLDVPVDLSSCFLVGDSAGGNIVHHVANCWAATWQSSAKSVHLAGIIPLQPFFGGEERTASELRLEGVAPVVNVRRSDSSWRAFLPVGSSHDHPAAHVTDDNAHLANAFPPALVVIGGFDPLQDWQRRYTDVLRRKGKAVQVVEFPDAFHEFYGFPELADAGKVLQVMRTFVESNRAPSKSTAL